MNKIYILIIIIIITSFTTVNAGWFGYDDGECKIFQITPPEGYYNHVNELDHDENLWLIKSSNEEKHELSLWEINKEEFEETSYNYTHNKITGKLYSDNTLNLTNITEDTIIIRYQTHEIDNDSEIINTTRALFKKDNHYYILQIAHKNCLFDDDEYNKDVENIEEMIDSLKRKE